MAPQLNDYEQLTLSQGMRWIAIADYVKASRAKAPDPELEALTVECDAWDRTVLRLAGEVDYGRASA